MRFFLSSVWENNSLEEIIGVSISVEIPLDVLEDVFLRVRS